jgi:ubiquinone/menaquinone biosynthesis C-methylase UbiE
VPFSTAPSIRDAAALQLLVNASRATPTDDVLDVACGPGVVACAFARVVRHVTGVDMTPAMLDRARDVATEQGVGNVTFRHGDVQALPFADGMFSLVASRLAFHHFPDPLAVLREMVRVCRPDGRVLVADLLASDDPAKAAAFHRMETRRDPSHARALTLSEIRRFLAESGLGSPVETFWQADIDVEDLLARSFPAPDDVPFVREAFVASVVDDAMGLRTRWEHGRLVFTYRYVALVASKAAA